jgi:hypothetical protein
VAVEPPGRQQRVGARPELEEHVVAGSVQDLGDTLEQRFVDPLGHVRQRVGEHADDVRRAAAEVPRRQVRHVAELLGCRMNPFAHRVAGREFFLPVEDATDGGGGDAAQPRDVGEGYPGGNTTRDLHQARMLLIHCYPLPHRPQTEHAPSGVVMAGRA